MLITHSVSFDITLNVGSRHLPVVHVRVTSKLKPQKFQIDPFQRFCPIVNLRLLKTRKMIGNYQWLLSDISSSDSSMLSILTSTAVITVGLVYSYHTYLSYQRSEEPPIIWSWIPYLGNAMDIGTKPIEFLQNCSKKQKDIIGLVVAGHRMFFITDPHSSNIIFKPSKFFSWEEFHNLVIVNFFGATKFAENTHPFDDDLMRKWFSTYIFRFIT